MVNSSKSNLIKKIHSEYNKKLKDLESKLAAKHKELNQIEIDLAHEKKKIEHSNISMLKSKRAELNTIIIQLKKEIKKVNKEKIKKLRSL
ncbi:MAG: hypothetical protein ACFFDX_14620 [Candidatus Odinarchaeota archaeon]